MHDTLCDRGRMERARPPFKPLPGGPRRAAPAPGPCFLRVLRFLQWPDDRSLAVIFPARPCFAAVSIPVCPGALLGAAALRRGGQAGCGGGRRCQFLRHVDPLPCPRACAAQAVPVAPPATHSPPHPPPF